MQVRLLVLTGIAGACGWLARGLAPLPEAAAAPEPRPILISAPPVYQVVMAAPPDCPPEHEAEVETEPEAEPEGVGEGEDLGAVIARVELAAADHNGIWGVITDKSTGAPLAGATVIVSGTQIMGSLTAITDEEGRYKLAGIPAGYVTVTLYYAESVIERPDVVISSIALTPFSEAIDPSPRIWQEPIQVPETINVVVPGRTFQSVIDSAIE